MAEHVFTQGLISCVVNGSHPEYNPIYFYGEPDHVSVVLDEVATQFASLNPGKKTNCISIDRLLYESILSIREERNEEFRLYLSRMEQSDLLIVDNVEYLSNRAYTQEMFYNLFNRAFEHGTRIVFGASTLPKDIPRLEDRNLTQLQGSIICKIEEE